MPSARFTRVDSSKRAGGSQRSSTVANARCAVRPARQPASRKSQVGSRKTVTRRMSQDSHTSHATPLATDLRLTCDLRLTSDLRPATDFRLATCDCLAPRDLRLGTVSVRFANALFLPQRLHRIDSRGAP